ncbi:hypothetical protein TNIN_112811 [Trichonephila inaurata madagascariensis]|uniref:SAM-dependent MTase RsmB/NOP-type domain-containing protein n=1 Tax=Trichonephila inaurata madagascariensis TaxID=2747483 RepID=A0A8X6XZC7_9ARAC|nr:hypothetical protein TNIN_112811 [Trichonephila inaurata madagascariensis]
MEMYTKQQVTLQSHSVKNALDQRCSVLAVFVDFKTAFDKVYSNFSQNIGTVSSFHRSMFGMLSLDSDESSSMSSIISRPHLSKSQRLPRTYKEVEKILKDAKACRGTVRNLMNNSRLRGSVFKKVYALSVNVLKHRRLLDQVIKDTQLLEREPSLREELAGILVYELIFGKGLPGESRPVTVVKSYRLKILDAYREAIKLDSLSFKDALTIPRYVRINTLRSSLSTVVNNLMDAKYKHIQYGKETSLNEYLDLVRKLEPCSYLIDYHFEDLIVFSHLENMSNWSMFKKNFVFAQDKSSYIPVAALDPKPGSTVLDACAAPGMKTVHMAAIMENKGKIYAFEKNSSRFQTLRQMLDRAPVKICEAHCMDFYSVDTMDPKYNSVEYILVDPTCSGSGMVNRMDSVTDTRDSKTAFRLQKLAGFQILLLKHALSFPSVKRVVYSTCSTSEEENEYVVHEVLENFQHIFKLVRVMPNWPIRGMEEYKFGKLCLRANPGETLTNGFFVAMFERMTSEEIERLSRDEWFFKDKWTKKKNKRQENWWPKDDYNDSDVLSEAFGSGSTSEVGNSTSTLTNESSSSHVSIKKKKKVRRASRELTDSSVVSSRTDYRSSASIASSEIYSSEGSVKAISTISKEGECSRKNIHSNKFLNNKQNKSFSKTKGNCDDNKSATEVFPAESSKTKSNEEGINNCSSSNSDKMSKKKKKQKHSFVKEESSDSEIQNEFHRNDMNIPDVESNSGKKKKKGSNNQEIQDRILSDENPNSKVRADNLSGSCSKADFGHELEEIDQSRTQCEGSKIKAKKEKKKKHDVRQNFDNPETLAESEQTQDAPKKKSKKKHMSSESTESGESVSKTASFTGIQDIPGKKHHVSSEITDSGENVNETVSCTEQTIEPQDTTEKKRKKRHNTSTESTEMGESACEPVSHIEETRLKKKHKKKCKDKKSKE